MNEDSTTTYAGFIALIGRPNVGKSALLNQILGKKISITANKPQTTRHSITGVRTIKNHQMIFVDTPGLHKTHQKRALNRYMNKAALTTLQDVDVIVWLIEPFFFREEDDWILEKLKTISRPLILVINKVDCCKDKTTLLPLMSTLNQKATFAAIIPLSAETGEHVDNLLTIITQYLPASPFLYSEQQITDRNDAFLVSEFIREKLTRFLGAELPYDATVTLEKLEAKGQLIRIQAIIWVARPGQKQIIIGENGERLKKIATEARLEIQKFFGRKVFLQVWVKIKDNWADDMSSLRTFGYE